MTKEDAIDIIKSECYVFNPLNFDRSTMVNTALDMAVKALKQEPCEDAISRKDFIAKIEDIYDGYMLDDGGCYPQNFVDLAEEMPSVQPEQKTALMTNADWIPVKERLPEIYQSVLVWCPNYKNIYCAYRSDDGAWEIFGGHRTLWEEVTAWRLLPEPPEEVEE